MYATIGMQSAKRHCESAHEDGAKDNARRRYAAKLDEIRFNFPSDRSIAARLPRDAGRRPREGGRRLRPAIGDSPTRRRRNNASSTRNAEIFNNRNSCDDRFIPLSLAMLRRGGRESEGLVRHGPDTRSSIRGGSSRPLFASAPPESSRGVSERERATFLSSLAEFPEYFGISLISVVAALVI